MAQPLPTFTGTVDQRFFIEPITGPSHPRNYLDRFPEEVYSRAPDSHLVKFLYALLGPAGIGWLKKNYLDARLALEARGIELFNLEGFYGDPLAFGRIFDELYVDDPTGLLPRDQWQIIKARDEGYRSRAMDYMHAVRLGNTPEGMRLAAKSGLGHNVEIVENYRYFFDQHSDDPLGLPYRGLTSSLQEFVVLPRAEISRSSVQEITFEQPVTAGTYILGYDGSFTAPLDYDADYFAVQSALQGLPTIGANNVSASSDGITITVQFTGRLSNQPVSLIQAIGALQDTSGPTPVNRGITITEALGGVDASTEVVDISSRARHQLQTAIDYLRPVGAIPTVSQGSGLRAKQEYTNLVASSEYTEVRRFVTGSPGVLWPSTDSIHWIVKGVEIEAPRTSALLQHYVGFHAIATARAYTDLALADGAYTSDTGVLANYKSEHIGRFDKDHAATISVLREFKDDSLLFDATQALARTSEPLTATGQDANGNLLISGIYPADYAQLPGVPRIVGSSPSFWASLERTSGSEVLELDFGRAQAINYLSFELIRVPVDIEVAYDLLDQAPRRSFVPVSPVKYADFPDHIYYEAQNQSPWQPLEFHFDNGLGRPIYTRFLRLKFTRRNDATTPSPRFLWNPVKNVQAPWSVEVRNLRVGRNANG